MSTINLDKPLVKFSPDPADWWCIREAFEGVQIFGGIGSGKSSGSGKTLAKAFLKNGFGGLVHCAKPEEKATWLQYAEETGRSDDIIVFEEGSPYQFNPLQYELTREGKGAGEVFNLSNLFMEIYKMGNRFTGASSGDKDRYWDNALRRSLNRMILLLKLADKEVSIANMRAIMSSAPNEDLTNALSDYTDEQWDQLYNTNYCIECILDASAKVEQVREELEDGNQDKAQVLEELEQDYALVYAYFLREFAKADEKTRSIVAESFLGLAEPFIMGVLKTHFASGLTLSPEVTFGGKIIILNFSVKEYLDSGMYAQGIFKLLWQQAVERRDTNRYPNPAFLWVDESQYFVNEYDTIFQTTARSSRVATVFLTQNISNYYSQMGGGDSSKSKVNSLLGNLSTKIFHANNDSVTNEWASNVIGKAMITLRSDSQNRKNFALMADSKGTSYSGHLLPQVLPMEFTTLWSGGKQRNYTVQAIIQVKGRKWSNGANFFEVEFSQL
ncbi:type IV secretory system conjugative DNA transfer family protein [Phaeodactylibacter luteus]|uniref:TraD/TraG TraM recognition site domain-containing protein n=1 Tax=Phaeodactylibacter luteus TaxID=1564516 RepID=A0A5C6RHJ2_9BACT|nr:TraM recognition domain-containing protein [Phaeodactylibacter luteus]TXB61355.1 hypothetical protein FRY97_19645 [Phaeodactylibacter luteus]